MPEVSEVDTAVDADRTPHDPELVAGAPKPDPWVEDPARWAGTEPDPWVEPGPGAVGREVAAATAVLTPALAELRATFNWLNPRRDKSSDGWIGDAAHSATSSDHNPDESGTVPIRDPDSLNEVHAVDVDETGPWPADDRGAFSLMRAVRQLVTDHRAGRERRLRYIIYERTIWSASWSWTAREYTGANPHDKHAHFSGSYDSALERDTRTWNIGFLEDDMANVRQRDWDALIWRVAALVAARTTVAGGPIPGEAVVLSQKVIGIEQKLTAVLGAVAGVDEATATRLQAEFDQIDSAVAATADADAQRDAELRALLEAHASGQVSAETVVRRLGEVLSTVA
ncbi:hypothetical protein WEI85_38500 [Actinomycetes bacterium KLBMP 9797]